MLWRYALLDNNLSFTSFAIAKRKVIKMNVDKSLLLRWWNYYGRHIYTMAELEKFEEIIEQYGPNKVFEVVVASSYICNDGSPTVLLLSIRKHMAEELFNSLPDIQKMGESERNEYHKLEQELISMISETQKE